MRLLDRVRSAVRGWVSIQPGGGPTLGSMPFFGDLAAPRPITTTVNPESASSLPALYAACSIYSSIAALRWRIVRRLDDGTPEEVRSTDAARALLLASYDDCEAMLFVAALVGNGYCWLHRNARGGIGSMEMIAPWRVSLAVDERGAQWYVLAPDPANGLPGATLPATDVWHLRFRTSGRTPRLGVSPMATCAPAFAAALQQRETMLALLGNISRPSVVLATEQTPTSAQRTEMRDAWENMTTGPNAGRTPVVSHGLKPITLQVPSATDAQMIDGMRFSVLEVARAYNLPPSCLAQTDQVSFAAAIEETRALVSLALRPWAYRVADSLARALLSLDERLAGHSIEIDTSALTLGSGKELAEAMSALVNGGVMSPNEARARLNLGPIGGGAELGRPVNTMAAENWAKHVGSGDKGKTTTS